MEQSTHVDNPIFDWNESARKEGFFNANCSWPAGLHVVSWSFASGVGGLSAYARKE